MDRRATATETIPARPEPSCPACKKALGGPHYREWRVCDACGHHFPLAAWERVRLLADPDTFREIDAGLTSDDPLHFVDTRPYPERLRQAQQTTGLAEAVVTGVGQIGGHRCVLAVSDFRFLGGSMGSVVGEKIARALECATADRVPFVAVTASGGARMQEGMLSLAQMAKTTAAATRLQQAGILSVTVLTDPTMGGVLASYATRSDVLLAEPGALIGFAGPRVVRELTGRELPPGFQTAEFLHEHGLVDAIVPRMELRRRLTDILRLVDRPHAPPARSTRVAGTPTTSEGSAWDAVQLARHPRRPTSLDYLPRILPNFFELRGDRVSGDDPAIIGGIGDLDGTTVVAIAQERGHGPEAAHHHGGRVGPAGYRKALRLMNLAEKLRLPLLTFVDTPGAALSIEAEAGGLAQTISACLSQLSVLPVPIVSIIVGEGGSGGAIALGVADRVLMLENAIYSVIAPEGAAAILFRTKERAREVAESLKLTARDCLRLGVVDEVVAEPAGGAQVDPERAIGIVRDALLGAFADLCQVGQLNLVATRYEKLRHLGIQGAG